MNSQKIICPQCKTSISIDDVLTHQIEESIKNQYQAEINKKNQEQAVLRQKLTQMQAAVAEQVQTAVSEEKKKLTVQLKQELQKEAAGEVTFLKEQLVSKEKKLDEAFKKELDLRKQAVALEEERKEFEVTKQRELDSERKKIAEAAAKKATDEQQFKLAEMSKQLHDAMKVNEELNRKLQQGSQQTQGEVLELELESLLRQEFPLDSIEPVGKGINGADVIQRVKDRFGRASGVIIWESKNTKNWTEGWVQKLKEDQRNQKAEVAILVTTVLPKGVETFGLYEGIWVTGFSTALAVAVALRSNLIQIAALKNSSVGKNEKMEVLFNYLTSTEFKQRIEGIVEAFTMMKGELDRERIAYKKIWEKREKLITRVLDNTVGMYGDLEAVIGNSLPKIDILELDSGDEQQELPL